MINKNNIVLVDKNFKDIFGFNSKNRIVKINKAVTELKTQQKEIIFEEAIIALDKYLDLKEKIDYRTAKKKALEFAKSKIEQKYLDERNWVINEFNNLRDYNNKASYKFSKKDDYISLGYFKDIILKEEFKNNDKILPTPKMELCNMIFKTKFSDDSKFFKVKNKSKLYNDNIKVDFEPPEIDMYTLGLTELCGTDAIAFYSPYHFYKENFGIYIKLKNIIDVMLNIYKETSLNFKESKEFALNLILRHEQFHYIVELFASSLEFNFNNYDVFYDYKKIYNKVFSSEECHEETLANAFIIQDTDEMSLERFNYLNEFFGRQSPGYREAKNLSINQRNRLYLKLEKQILNNNKDLSYSQIMNNILSLPLSKLYHGTSSNKKFNLPVYLVDNIKYEFENNNISDMIKYNTLKKLLFPNIFNNSEFMSDFKVEYSESNTWWQHQKEGIILKYPDKYLYTRNSYPSSFENKTTYNNISQKKINEIIYIIESIDFSKIKKDYSSGAMDVTRWELKIEYNNKKYILKGDYFVQSEIPDDLKYLLDKIKDVLKEKAQLKKIKSPEKLKSIKLKSNLNVQKIKDLIIKIGNMNNKFTERSSKLKSELKDSKYKRISILTYTWLSGWANTGGPYKNVEGEVRELSKELFGYEIDNIIKINGREINLKNYRKDKNKAENIKEDLIKFHNLKL